MGDNNEQERADLDAMNDDDGDHLFEVIYRGGRLDNDYDNIFGEENPRPLGVPDYNIPADVNIRLLIDLSITKIDMYACYECRTLSEVVFHNNVTEIGYVAFVGCFNLQHVELLEGLLRVEEDAFYACNSLREIVIPASVQYIGSEVFYECVSLIRVVFTSRTTSIELGNGMFDACSDLRFVTLPQNLQSIPADFFYGCTSLTHFQIPVSVEEIGACAFRDSAIQAMNYSVGDDFMPGTIILPPNLQSISGGCFEDCKSLSHIRIPPSVQSIEVDALNGSDLRSITIPETVREIGRKALGNCSSLKEVTFHSSTNLIMDHAIFANCSSLSVIKIAPWLLPKLFASMNEHPEFIFKFFQQYHPKIFDFNAWWVNRNVNHNDNEE